MSKSPKYTTGAFWSDRRSRITGVPFAVLGLVIAETEFPVQHPGRRESPEVLGLHFRAAAVFTQPRLQLHSRCHCTNQFTGCKGSGTVFLVFRKIVRSLSDLRSSAVGSAEVRVARSGSLETTKGLLGNQDVRSEPLVRKFPLPNVAADRRGVAVEDHRRFRRGEVVRNKAHRAHVPYCSFVWQVVKSERRGPVKTPKPSKRGPISRQSPPSTRYRNRTGVPRMRLWSPRPLDEAGILEPPIVRCAGLRKLVRVGADSRQNRWDRPTGDWESIGRSRDRLGDVASQEGGATGRRTGLRVAGSGGGFSGGGAESSARKTTAPRFPQGPWF